MPLELLVFLACLQPEACPQLSKAYYASHSEYAKWARKTTSQVEAQMGRELMVAIPVAYTVAASKPYQLKIYKKLTCGYNLNVTQCTYSWGF